MIALTARAHLECDDVEPLLSPCVDGELLDDDSASVNSHVARCDACRERLIELRAIKAALSSAGRSVELPEGLEAQLRFDLHRAARPDRVARAGVVFACVTGAVLAVVFVTMSSRRAPVPAVVTKVTTPAVVLAAMQRHRADLPVDVASPDPRPVQEFLASRLGTKLRVPRLDGFGFGLQGGRVVDVEDRQGAQLIYNGGYGQRVSVVALPDPDGALAARVLTNLSPLSSSSEGLSIRVLSNGGNLYTIVGDLDEHRLERLAHELER